MRDARPFRYLTREQFACLWFDDQFEYLRIAVAELAKTRATLRADRERILSHAENATKQRS